MIYAKLPTLAMTAKDTLSHLALFNAKRSFYPTDVRMCLEFYCTFAAQNVSYYEENNKDSLWSDAFTDSHIMWQQAITSQRPRHRASG